MARNPRIAWMALAGLMTAPCGALAQTGVGVTPWAWNGQDVFNYNQGFVGINTDTPSSRLHVKGRLTMQGDIKMQADSHSLLFPATTGTPAPMIFLYDQDIGNATRMVLSHSPDHPTWGLQYSDLADRFTFVHSIGPVLAIDDGVTVHQNMDVHQGIQLSGGLSWWALSFKSAQDSIVFPATSGVNEPMVQMFASGTTNSNRMVLSHSPNYENWGLQYRDAGDEFRFLGNGDTVLNVDLGSRRVTVASEVTSGSAAFQVGDAGDGTFAVANSWSLFSSRDYKKDIEQLTDQDCQDVLTEVVDTPVFRFRYKGESEDRDQRLGLIVEESPADVLCPETKAVDLGRYVSSLHAALKAQQEMLDAQQAELASLRDAVAALSAAR